MGHVAAVAHVPPATGLIWPHIVDAENQAVLFSTMWSIAKAMFVRLLRRFREERIVA
jgi:hypothetical protein